MSNSRDLDAQFDAIMAGNRNKITTHHQPSTARSSPSRAANNIPLTTSGGGYGPSRTRARNERVPPQPNIQEKYDTVVEGFKILEAKYEESEMKLAMTEERLRAVDVAYATLVSEVEAGRQALRDREMEIETLRKDVKVNKTTRDDREAEIETIRKELEASKTALSAREERISAINVAIKELLECGICHNILTQPHSTDCRHVFCVTCLFEWWKGSRTTTCPTCRTVCESTPTGEPFNTGRFDVLMAEIKKEAEEKQALDAQFEMLVDNPGDIGTFIHPLDLTSVWN